MSGIYGVVTQNNISDLETTLLRMRQALPAYGPMVQHEWLNEAGQVGLGAIHPTRISQPGHYAADPAAGVHCVFDGIIYRDTAGPGDSLVEPDGAALLLQRYLKSGTDCLSQLNGSFVAAWWDEKAGRLVVANDKIGQRLLFFGCRNGAFAFASLLARVMASGFMSAGVDVEALADLISYEHTIGERTLLKDVRILPPATVLTYQAGQVELKQYWRLDQIEPHQPYDQRQLDELEELFKKAVKRAIRPDLAMAIDLTGGLDSRCILAAAAHMQLPFITHTGGQVDSTDVVLARQAAAVTGAKHVFEPVGPERVAEWLVPMVRFQGGIISTLHSHPCQHFDLPLPFDATLQGIGINYIRGYWVSRDNLDLDSLSAAQSVLKRSISSKTAKRMDLAKLWKPEFQKIGLQAPEAHLEHLFEQYDTLDRPAAILDSISLQERCRKFLNKAILITRASREVYYPYFDHDLIVALAGMPVAERVTHKIQVDLIKRFCPKLLDVPSAKSLMPLSASPRQIWLTQRYWAIKRRVSRRLGSSPGIPAKVPNHYFSRWVRTEMREMLVNLLYNPQAAFRAYLNWDTVETLLKQHFSGQTDWEHLVAALTVFEISHRLWVDPDPAWSPDL